MFHLRDGFSFERNYKGDVAIEFRRPAKGAGDDFVASIVVPEGEWASVLAAVCARGETSETWQEARDYHSRP